MMPMNKFGEMDKFENGRSRGIKNHSERRNDYFFQTPYKDAILSIMKD